MQAAGLAPDLLVCVLYTRCLWLNVAQSCAKPPVYTDLDIQPLCASAGNSRQLIVSTLFDLLFSSSAARITQQRLLDIEKTTLKLIFNNNIGKDILLPDVRLLYLQQLQKNGIGDYSCPLLHTGVHPAGRH